MRVAVTGASGRLGRALVAALADAPFTGLTGPVAWGRPAFDLDRPQAYKTLVDRDRPELVVHAAAWTDVDGCARDPQLAMSRNAMATRALAEALATRGLDLIVVSTNEVFGARPGTTELRPHRVTDAPDPMNAYGRSKLAGERHAEAVYGGSVGRLGIVRTAWLFGPPGNDFPEKILAAADRARSSGEPLKLVADEIGCPTYTHDLAEAIVELIAEDAVTGIHHLVNYGVATREQWASEVLRQAGVEVDTQPVSLDEWPRPSTPPLFGVLEPTPLPSGEPLRSWQGAIADYLPTLLRQRAARTVSARS